MDKIHKKFITEAIRIRQSYLKNIKKIHEKEEIIMSYKKDIEKIISDTEIIVKKSSENTNTKELSKILNEKLIEIEININKIQKELQPIHKKNEKLEKDSKKLYETIRDNHKLEEKEIQNQIIVELSKKNLL